MKKTTLQRAIAEAERFLEKARAAREELRKEFDADTGGSDGFVLPHYFPSGKILAACKRASMDLSRCLSDLRQNR
jgi:hypothetical protein